MSKEPQKSNFELAQEEANKIDLQIIDTFKRDIIFVLKLGPGQAKPIHLIRLLSGYK